MEIGDWRLLKLEDNKSEKFPWRRSSSQVKLISLQYLLSPAIKMLSLSLTLVIVMVLICVKSQCQYLSQTEIGSRPSIDDIKGGVMLFPHL